MIGSGIPQNSYLSPLLYNLYINHVVETFSHGDFLMLADDLKIFITEDCALIQKDINTTKCNFISFSRKTPDLIITNNVNRSPLLSCDIINDPMVTLDREESFIVDTY